MIILIATALVISGHVPAVHAFDPMASFTNHAAWVQSDVRALAQGNGTVRTYEHPQVGK